MTTEVIELSRGASRVFLPGWWPCNTYCSGNSCPHFLVPPFSRDAEPHWFEDIGYIVLREGDGFTAEDGTNYVVERK